MHDLLIFCDKTQGVILTPCNQLLDFIPIIPTGWITSDLTVHQHDVICKLDYGAIAMDRKEFMGEQEH